MDRFWGKVDKSVDCWEWTGYKNKKGYGTVKRNGRTYLAHRYSLVLSGYNISNKYVLHNCDNPSCVNPNHLYLGTQKDNMFDKVRKGRHHNSRKTMCKWGHTFTDKNTYVCKDGSRKCIRCRNKRNSERKRLRG